MFSGQSSLLEDVDRHYESIGLSVLLPRKRSPLGASTAAFTDTLDRHPQNLAMLLHRRMLQLQTGLCGAHALI